MKTQLTISSRPSISIPSALILILVAAVGCGRQPTAPDAHPKDSGRRATDFPTNVTEYQVRGVLREILEQGAKARIAHEDIPGYMEAMVLSSGRPATRDLWPDNRRHAATGCSSPPHRRRANRRGPGEGSEAARLVSS